MKGFFSFIIVLFIIIFLLNITTFFNEETHKKQEIINQLIEIEYFTKERTLLENNVDNLIKIKLDEQLKSSNFDLIFAKQNINNSLFNFLKNKSKESDIFLENEKALTLDFLNQTTSLEIFETKNIKYAQFVFTSNILKNKNISKVFGKDFEIIFKIPIGYLKRTVIINA